ncbi:hypothetical protein KO486_12775 [Octadecabacter sp. B2R22]|uniref:hypothetical protein n=1 Tax=Octadecabacter sp. B2R22 TaxID=2841570 RepID=UPI001C09C803|nr:hypothetical protein [Octadecabacter sp. B2R22]MBU2994083.1 hypothetical protein [Octadecabacter sp. B2R22]
MNEQAQMVLHVGAPKCGSSALQAALSMTPDLTGKDGRQYRYTTWKKAAGVGRVQYGRGVTVAAKWSAFGYTSWPNIKNTEVDAPMFAALNRARLSGLRKGHVPIASCEGWIDRVDMFAHHLKSWGNPPVDVVAYLRPVVDWYNSAFWQWGVWNVKSMDAWINRTKTHYTFGTNLEAWSAIPNVSVRYAWAQPDVVARFSDHLGVDLPAAEQSNVSSSPALIGVLRRHRRLRRSGHDAHTEFVVQRWCPQVGGRRLWAITPRHADILRPIAQTNLEALKRVASDAAMNQVCDDVRWLDDTRWQDEIDRGVSPMNDPEQMAALFQSLTIGLERIAETGVKVSADMPDSPNISASIKEWDSAILMLLDALLRADKDARFQAVGGSAGKLLRRVNGLVKKP